MTMAHELLGPLPDPTTINDSVESLVKLIEDRYRG